jgi:hypothetical protein
VSLAHQSHPEFEYFRPLWNFLRKAGIAVALISFAVISGALVLWAAHDSTADVALMTASGNDIPSSAPTTSVADRAPPATAAESPPLPEASAAACEQDTWAYLDGKCIPAKARKLRSPRAATGGLLGRSALATSQTSGRDVGKSNSSSREERGRDERWSARAYASPDSRNPAGPYERSWDWSR